MLCRRCSVNGDRHAGDGGMPVTNSVEPSYCLRDRPPASLPIWLESLAVLDWLGLHMSPVYWGCGVPRGDGTAVVLVPGFLGDDWYLLELYSWLRRIGYRPYMSRIGRNADCLDLLASRLIETTQTAHRQTGRKVHLIGHSLGGMLARAGASIRPDLVSSVTVLGSPFRGIRSHPIVLEMSERVRTRILSRRHRAAGANEQPDCYTSACSCTAVSAFQQPMPDAIPFVAIYTRTDGIVDWRFCVN